MKRLALLIALVAAAAHAQTAKYDLRVRYDRQAGVMHVDGKASFPADTKPQPTFDVRLVSLAKNVEWRARFPIRQNGTRGPNTIWTATKRGGFRANEWIDIGFRYDISGTTRILHVGHDLAFGLGGASGSAWYPHTGDANVVGRLRFEVPGGDSVYSAGARTAPGDFTITNPTTAGFAIAPYRVVQRGKFAGYFLHERPSIDAYVDAYRRILQFYDASFGPLPFAQFALVEIPTEDAGAAGFGGATIAGAILATTRILDQPPLLAYHAHEIAHQWWGDAVQFGGGRGDFLFDEAMAQFSALRAVEHIEGPAMAMRFRRDGYPGFNTYRDCALGYLRLAATGTDFKLAELPDRYESYWLAYSKGFLVWDMLAREVGAETFFRVLRSIVAKYSFRTMTYADFTSELARVTNRDLGWFFAQWHERTGAPRLDLSWRQDGGRVHVQVTQPEPAYRVTIPIRLRGGEALDRRVELRSSNESFDVDAPFAVTSVELDPDYKVLHATPSMLEEARAQAPYTAGYVQWRSGDAEKALATMRAARGKVEIPDRYAVGFLLDLGRGQILNSQRKFAEALPLLESAVKAPSRIAYQLPSAYLELEKAALGVGDRARAEQAAQGAITADALIGNRGGVAAEARRLLDQR